VARVRAVYHGRYNVRDQPGHWVKPKTARGHLCHHSCCNGTRVHPDKLPVKISRSYLRTLTPPQLDEELGAYSHYSATHEEGFLQVLAEVDRREESEKRAAARKMRARDKREHRQSEYEDEVYRQWLGAEAATNGFMLNRATVAAVKAGKIADVDERSLFTGPESRVRKYASPELVEWFEHNPRPTRASWFGSTYSRRAHLAGRRIG